MDIETWKFEFGCHLRSGFNNKLNAGWYGDISTYY